MQRITLALFCATVALLSATLVVGEKNNLVVGNRVYGDYLLEQQEVEKGSIIFKVREKTVTLKGDGISKITSVEMLDLKHNGHAATPTIVSGGPGQTFVSVNFKSKRGHGIHYLVKIYGK